MRRQVPARCAKLEQPTDCQNNGFERKDAKTKQHDKILTNNADIIRDTLSKTKDIRVENSIESSSRINAAEKNQIKILEKNNTAEKKPSLLNKLKENEKTVKQKPEKQKQKSVDKEQLAI